MLTTFFKTQKHSILRAISGQMDKNGDSLNGIDWTVKKRGGIAQCWGLHSVPVSVGLPVMVKKTVHCGHGDLKRSGTGRSSGIP
jgi:hypothetical protein